MGIKTVSGPRCMKHQIECLYNCGWCSKPICDECIAFAHGKKYCEKCWQKKQQSTPAPMQAEQSAPRPRVTIKNVDTTLDPKVAEQKRIELPNKKQVDPRIFEL